MLGLNEKNLSAPDFVKMLEDEDYVYFFLREQAVEYINCGKVILTFLFLDFNFFGYWYKLCSDQCLYIVRHLETSLLIF